MSTERELFEEWVFADSEMQAWANPKANYRRPDGRYFYAHAEIAWIAWQAARSADTSGARRPDENSPSGPSDRALNPQPEAVDHDRGA